MPVPPCLGHPVPWEHDLLTKRSWPQFYKNVQEEQGNIKVEEEEIPEDKDDEKCNPAHSESSSDNVDTTEDHQGEKGTFLSNTEKITWSSSQRGSQGRMTAHSEIKMTLGPVRQAVFCLFSTAMQGQVHSRYESRMLIHLHMTSVWTKTPHGIDW